MQSSNLDFLSILDRVIDKSVDLTEKSITAFEPTVLSLLQRFEQWLDSKLDQSSGS